MNLPVFSHRQKHHRIRRIESPMQSTESKYCNGKESKVDCMEANRAEPKYNIQPFNNFLHQWCTEKYLLKHFNNQKKHYFLARKNENIIDSNEIWWRKVTQSKQIPNNHVKMSARKNGTNKS